MYAILFDFSQNKGLVKTYLVSIFTKIPSVKIQVIFHGARLNKTGKVRIKVTFEARSCTHCYRGKVISITYSQCVSVALIIQNGTRVRRVILSYVAYPFLQQFSTLSHKRHDFRNESSVYKMRVLILSANFV